MIRKLNQHIFQYIIDYFFYQRIIWRLYLRLEPTTYHNSKMIRNWNNLKSLYNYKINIVLD